MTPLFPEADKSARVANRFTPQIKSCDGLGEQGSRVALQTAQHPFGTMAEQIYHKLQHFSSSLTLLICFLQFILAQHTCASQLLLLTFEFNRK